MPRAKGGAKTRQRRKKVLKQAKGYFGGRRQVSTARRRRRCSARAPSPTRGASRRSGGRGRSGSSASTRRAGPSGCPTRSFMAGLKKAGVTARPEDPRRARCAAIPPPSPSWRRRRGAAAASSREPRTPGSRRSATGPWRRSPGPGPRPSSSRSASGCSAAPVRSPSLLRSLGSLPAAERPQRRPGGQPGQAGARRPPSPAGWRLSSGRGARAAPASRSGWTSRCPAASSRPGRGHPLTRVLERDHRDLRGARLLGGRGARGRDRLLQLRRAQLPGRPPGARHAGHLPRVGRRAPPHPHLAGADPHHAGPQRPPVRTISPGKVYRRDSPTPPTRRCSTRSRGSPSTATSRWRDLKATLELFAKRDVRPARRGCASARRSSRSPSPRRRPTCCASSAAVTAAGSASRAAGSRSSARAWCIPNVLRNVGYDPEDVTGLGLRHGRRARRHPQVRGGRHPPLLRERPPLPPAVRAAARRASPPQREAAG